MIDVDLVYLWVDGNDPIWQAKRNACIGKPEEKSAINCAGRYADNDELKYSLRSVSMYAPWIRKIFIVTDNQIPKWIDTSHQKIRVVDHTEIMPSEILPCFNSSLLEHFLYKIPGLSEYFLYANDDMFINKPVNVGTFFAPDGLPIIRLNRRPFRKWALSFREKVLGKPLKNYNQIIQNAAKLVEKKYGTYYEGKPHHNIDAYLKSDYQHAEDVFRSEIEATYPNHVRSTNDIQRSLISYVAMAEKRAHVCYVTQKTSFRLHIENKGHYGKLERYDPILFCANDSEYAADSDRVRARAYLEKRFPEKSEFEK